MIKPEYVSAPLPANWDDINTCRFINYLDEHHGSDSDLPAFGFVTRGRAWCEEPAALDAAIRAAAAG